MSLAAVFSPTPGTPGRLSLGSPRSAVLRVERRRHARALLDAGLVVERVVRHASPVVEHLHVRVLDELVRVPVARDDDDVVATGLRLLRQRGDDVVRFEACEVHGHDPEGIDHLAHQPHLLAQDVGCLVPIALVGGDGVVSERPLGPVERR